MGINKRHTAKRNEVVSSTQLSLIAVYDSETGNEVPVSDFESAARKVLSTAATSQQELIDHNAEIIPNRTNDLFGAKWARDNIELPDGYTYHDDDRQTYWSTVNDKCEAARLILAWKKRDEIASAFDAVGWDRSIDEIADYLGKYVDWRLYKNIKAMGCHPNVPHVSHPRFVFSMMNPQVCQQIAFVDIVWLHRTAIGNGIYDLIFDAHDLYERYPGIVSLSRPTMRWHDGLFFDFSVTEDIASAQVSKVNHVVAFDRNMDHKRCISGVRMSSNGQVSYELGSSIDTEKVIQHERLVKVDLDRKKAKKKRMMPWDKEEQFDSNGKRVKTKYDRLCNDIDRISERSDALKGSIDWHEAHDMLCHLRSGESLVVEQLDMFGGGAVKFRHGSTDDKIEHSCRRNGVNVVHVNPAGTTSTCPVCCSNVRFLDDRVVECTNDDCSWRDDRDCGSAPVIGARGLERLGYVDPENGYAVHDLGDRERRSRVRRERRERKMVRRAERGSRVYRVKDKPTPSRPSLKLREGVSCFSERVAETREKVSLLDATRDALGLRAAGGDCSVTGFFDACGGNPFGPWAKTNTCLFEYGKATSDAYFNELQTKPPRRRKKRNK